ncbi:alpha/beta hydrolase [Sphingomonas gei]|nr:alpha/beta hydrolase [Sphingomonas gei]
MTGPAILAAGIDDYVALVSAQPPAADLETMRLVGDLNGHRYAEGFDPGVRRFDSYVAAPRREIALRVFDPGGEEPRPALCYFHGGGFALGSIESFDIVGAGLAEATGAVVVSVQYRRLPETDYAGARADCDAAFAWLARHAEALGVDPARIGVAGDSAGALLALSLCAANAQPICQLLFYGTFAMDPEAPAYANGLDPLLTADRVRQYITLFTRCGGLDDNPAPVDRQDLAVLPPTHIVAAEHDPLCAEAVQLAARLEEAGVPTTIRIAPKMIHGFLRALGVSAAARAEVAAAAEAIRPMLWALAPIETRKAMA